MICSDTGWNTFQAASQAAFARGLRRIATPWMWEEGVSECKMVVSQMWRLHYQANETQTKQEDQCSSISWYPKRNKSEHFVYRSTLHESDHELVVSSLRFKIKVKRRQTRSPLYQTTNISPSSKASFQSVLFDTFHHSDQSSAVNSLWDSFKSFIHKACESLPHALRLIDPYWITDEVHNQSKNKQEAWIRFKNAPSESITCLKTEYNHLRKLTRVAAEKARNSWWSKRAVEAER